ncbi:hydantoinase B/oxoprolinase family protein [Agrobacterium rosae]|uniref:Hydantoinase B/oxoprolinase family protein n=1 Tax=Agrobacterium rosae TaxID=1972867 RepID=A0AAW9FFR7_9HYPH|nr:hydantoinase B/oxoprolinase family protein [Agrobacterium rosae]MDX8304386.1 hydantoinase B/oxoprolinase family protein [Agrobacterium rosae]
MSVGTLKAGPEPENAKVDPITLQVIGGALETIAKEMGHVLYRMSYSSIIRESEDLGAGLFDADFNTLSESDSTPMHIGSLPAYLRGVRATMAGSYEPGDIIIHNHPYYGASHSPDIAIISPVFHDGELVGFAANTAHHVDIGAATPGLIIDVPDVFAEGMLIAGLKLYRRGVRDETLWSFIKGNTRVPALVMGDLEAQIASAELGRRRFEELLKEYGRETLKTATHQLMDYSEAMLRREIAKIPDGDYTAEGFLDDDGRTRGVHLPIKVTVKVRGDDVEVDLTGTCDQVPTAFNVPFEGSTKVACYFAFRALLLDTATTDQHVMQNEGSFRPVKVTAPAGCLFNPTFPAACEARFSQIQRLVDLIIKALAPVIPDRVTAGNAATLSFAAYSGLTPAGDYWLFLECNEGSYGGRPASDGPDVVDEQMRNTRNNPIEDCGMNLPVICDRYEMRDDVLPGAGKFRGGYGVIKTQRFLTKGQVTHEADRHDDTPWGVFGGLPGAGGRVVLTRADGSAEEMPAKISNVSMAYGDAISIFSPCGGGYGDPLDRSPDKVLADVLDDFIDPAYAHKVYGVVISENRVIDGQATERLRGERRAVNEKA